MEKKEEKKQEIFKEEQENRKTVKKSSRFPLPAHRTGERKAVKELSQKSRLSFEKEKKVFKRRSFFRQYRIFRKNGLGVLDSFFNSFYITLSEKSVAKEKARLEKQGEKNVPRRHYMELHALHLRFLSALFSKIGAAVTGILSFGRRGDKGNVHRLKLDFLKSHLSHCIIITLALFVTVYIGVTLSFPVVLRAEIDGKIIGVVENKHVVDSAINELEDNVERILGESFHFPYEVRYDFSRQRVNTITPKNKISEQLYTYILDSICTAGGLYVDGVLVAVCRDAETVNAGIEEFISANHKGEESGIFNELRVVTQAYPTDSIITSQQLIRLLEEMSRPLEDREKIPIPEQNVDPLPEDDEEESVPAMVLVSDATVGEKAQTGSVSNRPQSIEKIKLDFYTSQDISYEASIPYKTIYKESSQHYTTMADATVRGENGRSDVTARVYYVNGKEVRREILSEKVLRKPVDRVISIGLKILPEDLGITSFTASPGRLIVPRVGAISSAFGERFDGLHKAWDIPGDIGDNIYASASGTVICAIGPNYVEANRPLEYFTTYGYCVIIDHGNGYTTLYAHCSDINVRVGQKVKQGEKIGEVGDTGNTTGSHVHFEVRVNDVRMNPGDYLYTGKTTIYN